MNRLSVLNRLYVLSSCFWICLICIQIILIFYRQDISRISFGICFWVLFAFKSGEWIIFHMHERFYKYFELLIWIGSCFLIIYMLIIILVMIKYDQLLNLNSWYEPIYILMTSELTAPYLIDVISWALRYEYFCLIMIMNLWYASQNTHANRVVLFFVYIVSEP